MEFLAPAFLFFLLGTPLVFVLRNARRHLGHSLLRWAALVLLILALARPAQIADSPTEHLILLVDRSASIHADELARTDQFALRLAKSLPRTSKLQRLDFGDAQQTALGDALRKAASMIPVGEPGSVLVATDGAATYADWHASSELSERGIPIHLLPLTTTATDPRIVGLNPQTELRVGHPAELAVRLEGSPALVQIGLYAVGTDTALVSSEPIELDGPQTVTLAFEPAEAGFLKMEARLEVLEGANSQRQNDHWRKSFAVQDPTPILYLGQRMQGGQQKLGELIGPGFALQSGADLQRLQASDFSLVLLDDRPAATVPASFQQQLSQAVTEGGTGLLMSGGSGSFGPGGWSDTPVADLLPVDFVQKEEKRDPSTTLVVIIDTSGSMGGNRVQLAKEVARLAIHRLLPHDKAGIVEFYGAKHWAAPIQPASNVIELERALNRMSAGGGTVILPAIEEAFYAMQNVQTRYKHVLVLTDGGVETGDFESLLRNMTDKGITTSTVLIGSQAHSEFLVNMANWGKGRFYNVPNRFNLPEVILKQPASAKLPAYRPGAHQLEGHGSAGWWADTDPNAVPNLDGYIETRARPGAEVLLETVQGKHPVFASWRYGLGRVSALTTEPVGPGTRGWQNWDGLGSFLAQLLDRTADDDRNDFRYTLERRGAEVFLTAHLRSGRQALPVARIIDPELQLEAKFREFAPGTFVARLIVSPTQALHIEAGSSAAASQRTRLVLDPYSDRAPELQVGTQSLMPLRQLTAATGGRILADPNVSPTTSVGQARLLREYAPWLIALALLLFLADLYTRRRAAFLGGVA
jgi:Ca-activated chloride channel homolog